MAESESNIPQRSVSETAPPPPVRTAGGGASPFRILKPGQGVYVRWATAAGAGLLALAGAAFVSQQIVIFQFADNQYVRLLVPVLVFLAAAYGIFYLVGRKESVVDFLIATEGEMKKVNWSSRKEIWGATRIVIVTLLFLACVLFVVDTLFILLFNWIGVLRIDLIERVLGGGTGR